VALLMAVMAATPALQLEWRGAPECPTREAFLADVRKLRGEVVEATGDGAIVVEVTLTPLESRWRANVATRSVRGEGTRSLEADTCAEAIAAAAVVVSLALADPEPAAPAPEPAPAPPPVATERAAVFALGVTGGVRIGPLPGVAPGASLAAALSLSAFRVELTATTPFLTRVTKAGAAADLAWWVSARLSGCYEVSFERVAVGPCVLAHGGYLQGRGVSGPATTSAGAALLALSAGVLARVRLFSGLWLRFDGSGGAALLRPRFVTTTDGVKSTLAEAAPWVFDLNLGVEWRFDERP
jgi:hypothetical protein